MANDSEDRRSRNVKNNLVTVTRKWSFGTYPNSPDLSQEGRIVSTDNQTHNRAAPHFEHCQLSC